MVVVKHLKNYNELFAESFRITNEKELKKFRKQYKTINRTTGQGSKSPAHNPGTLSTVRLRSSRLSSLFRWLERILL